MKETVQIENPFKPLVYDVELSDFDLGLPLPENRITTTLTLDDYDWMYYTLNTQFPTKEQGFLNISIRYFGTTESVMLVTKYNNTKDYYAYYTKDSVREKQDSYKYSFDSKIFADFIKKFLTRHMEQWDSHYAFCGEDLAIELFNTVLEKYTKLEKMDEEETKFWKN